MSNPLAGSYAQTGQSAKAQAIALRRTRIPRTLYLSSGARTFPLVIYASAAINLIFWGNLASWVFTDYAVKKTEAVSSTSDADADLVAAQFERAPLGKRVAYASGLAGLGLAISTGFLLVSKRVVRRVDLLPGGTHVKLYTGFGRPPSAPALQIATSKTSVPTLPQESASGVQIALTDLTLRKALYTGAGPNQAHSEGGSYTQLLRRGQLIGYLLDRRGSFLGGPKVFDALVATTSSIRR
jgi:hypothetical protein